MWQLQVLKKWMKNNDCYIEHFDCHLRDKMVQKEAENLKATGGVDGGPS